MADLKQSTSRVISFFMTLASDHLTAATGKTPVVNISKAGAAFAAAAGAVAEIGNGWYKVTLTTVDANTLGDLAFHITGTSCDDTDFKEQVVALDPFTATVNPGAGGIAAASFAAGAINSAAIAADAIGSSQLAATGAQEIADALLDRVDAVETGLTFRQALRLMAAALAGKLSGAATATVSIRNAVADSKARITATVDSDGNRSSITTDLT